MLVAVTLPPRGANLSENGAPPKESRVARWRPIVKMSWKNLDVAVPGETLLLDLGGVRAPESFPVLVVKVSPSDLSLWSMVD